METKTSWDMIAASKLAAAAGVDLGFSHDKDGV